MSQNPLNLALRFILELGVFYSLGYWGWTTHTGLPRWLWAVGLPLLGAVLWGVFREANPEVSGKGLVVVPGAVRLALEAALFGGAVWAFYAAGKPNWGLVFGLVALFHYLLSYDRVWSLLIRRSEIK